jgi:hypothetical protein
MGAQNITDRTVAHRATVQEGDARNMTLTIHDVEQGSQQWLDLRCGLLTASTIGKLLTATGKLADNETARGLILSLAAERITGHVEYIYPSIEMQRGTEDEPFAREAYAGHYADVTETGLMVLANDQYTIGYSPDGLVGEDGLIEIKSRNPKVHLQTILADKPPAANLAQLFTGLFISGRSWIDYVSYCQGMPLWTKRIYRDDKWFVAIEDAALSFESRIAAILGDYLEKIDGRPMIERRPDLDAMVI